jgi:hypothetical protein
MGRIAFCFQIKKGQTIAESFLQYKAKSPIRPQIRTMLESWVTVRPSIYKLIRYEEQNVALMQSIFNDEEKSVYLTDDGDPLPEIGCLILGFLVPMYNGVIRYRDTLQISLA